MAETKIIAIVIGVIIALLLILNIIGSTSNDVIDAADSVTDANNCSSGTDTAGIALRYNATDASCYNSSGLNTTRGNAVYVAGQYDLPLNTLFSSSGIIVILLMIALFFALLGVGFWLWRKK